jgi:2-iminobutanoate/2-iminopropanoate deaminase
VKSAVRSPGGAAPVGPYSPALRAGNLLLISGQIALDPARGHIIDGGIAAQTRCVLENIGALLAAADLSFANVIKTTVFLADLADFAVMNEIYGAFFEEPYPARSTVQAARLPRDARIEIDAIATFDL